jgi:hypothetical protein
MVGLIHYKVVFFGNLSYSKALLYKPDLLFHSDGFRQIAWLIHIQST